MRCRPVLDTHMPTGGKKATTELSTNHIKPY